MGGIFDENKNKSKMNYNGVQQVYGKENHMPCFTLDFNGEEVDVYCDIKLGNTFSVSVAYILKEDGLFTPSGMEAEILEAEITDEMESDKMYFLERIFGIEPHQMNEL